VAALIHGLVRENRNLAGLPDRFLSEINRGLQNLLSSSGELVFVTAVYLVIDVARGELRMANAGHPSPILQRFEGETEAVCVGEFGSGPALGMLPDESYSAATVPLSPGDRLFLFTDGLYEVTDAEGEEFGHGRLRGAIAGLGSVATTVLLDQILANVKKFGEAGSGLADDICLLGVDFAPRHAS
jgi:sigma-B regulation protein RsbU (phosphoserine phosphatase)